MTFIRKCKIILDTILKRKKTCYYRTENREVEVSQMAKYNKNLENLAKDILVKNDMLKIPVNLIDIANNNNIEVYYVSLPQGISGAIKYNEEKKKFQILIEKNEPEYRKRFTLAHELSHYFLQGTSFFNEHKIHYDVLYRSGTSKIEKEADYFAGALLINKELLLKLFQINPSIKELAKTFMVSESALTVRLMAIGVL